MLILHRHHHYPRGDCDVRMMRFGMPRGGPRLALHCGECASRFFIAAGSFFSIRERVAKILPEPFTTAPDARVADPAGVWRDVLLVVEGPPPHAAAAPPISTAVLDDSR